MSGKGDGVPGRVLVVCLTNWSFGEATLGIRLIKNAVFKDVHFVISPFLAPLFHHHNLSFTELVPGSDTGRINRLLFLSVVEHFKPDEIILDDPLTFLDSEVYYGLNVDYISSFNRLVSCIDIYAVSYRKEVSFPKGLIFKDYEKLLATFSRFFIPCPMFDPKLISPIDPVGKIACYSALPELSQDAGRRHCADPQKELQVVITSSAWEDKVPSSDSRKGIIQNYVRSYMFEVLSDLFRLTPLIIHLPGIPSINPLDLDQLS